MTEERIKELANDLWDLIIHFNATQEDVTNAIRAAVEEAGRGAASSSNTPEGK